MPLTWFRVEQFRCLEEVELELDPELNFFVGPNASGKTSLLEAAFFLGRGRSFRTRRIDALIRSGAPALTVAGRSTGGSLPVNLGIRAARGSTEIRVGAAPARSAAELAEHFPAQVIDPEIHKLLEEGPGRRRRFLDWGVFHVEPAFMETWQRYQRALRQRNAALRQAQADSQVEAWDQELAQTGEALAAQREAYLEQLAGPLADMGRVLLGAEVSVAHQRGWSEDEALLAALGAGRERDRRYRATQAGPHRADLVVRVAGVIAKDRVSRGQQKLLAAGLTLAQLVVQEELRPGRSALLLDDPAAELDPDSLGRLLSAVRSIPAQLWVTSLNPDVPGLPAQRRAFHVEQGGVRPA